MYDRRVLAMHDDTSFRLLQRENTKFDISNLLQLDNGISHF